MRVFEMVDDSRDRLGYHTIPSTSLMSVKSPYKYYVLVTSEIPGIKMAKKRLLAIYFDIFKNAFLGFLL